MTGGDDETVTLTGAEEGSFFEPSYRQDGETTLIQLLGAELPEPETMASAEDIAQITKGDQIQVVFWSDISKEQKVATLTVVENQGDFLIVNNAHNIINGGDSGGGGYYNGQLIGNTWLISSGGTATLALIPPSLRR